MDIVYLKKNCKQLLIIKGPDSIDVGQTYVPIGHYCTSEKSDAVLSVSCKVQSIR